MELIKFIGLISVVGISIAIGKLLAKGYINRVRNLLDFITVFNILYTKIRYNQEILENIFLDVQKEIKRDVSKIFYEVGTTYETSDLPISDIWNSVVEKYFRDLDLTFEDERILIDFGFSLGRTDIEGQLKSIELTIEKLKGQLFYAKEARDKYSKMYQTMGTMGGIAIAIILI